MSFRLEDLTGHVSEKWHSVEGVGSKEEKSHMHRGSKDEEREGRRDGERRGTGKKRGSRRGREGKMTEREK